MNTTTPESKHPSSETASRRVVPVLAAGFRTAALWALAALVLPCAAEAATVWTGPRINRSDANGPDLVTPLVALTRGATQGLYNHQQETQFTHFLSPIDTEWANGTTANYATLSYTDWNTWAKTLNGGPPNTVGIDAVVHLKTDDIYMDIKFLSWTSTGAYSYERSTPPANTPLPPRVILVGRVGGEAFGNSVAVLPNGNLVVTDPLYDAPGPITDVGAVYLYDGVTLAIISTLTGSTAGDEVGSGGITVLSNGDFVVSSPYWDNGATTDAGAVTWGSVTAGVTGVVSVANSLVGGTAGDSIGEVNLQVLSNGNYVVSSPRWNNGAVVDAGAVTWGNGLGGTVGAVSAANSLVGSTANDRIGSFSLAVLRNGNYVVPSPDWNNGAVVDAGAVTWGSGLGGTVGAVSAANSLVGSTANDRIGSFSLAVLRNGNYVVSSPKWDNGAVTDAGAATWGDGTTGVNGPVTSANSLVGSKVFDQIGAGAVEALNNGHYVVGSPKWDNGAVTDAGAATWGSGVTGVAGPVTVANSLVGSKAGDGVGAGVKALHNGNYVVSSFDWDSGVATDVGAATWGNGTTGVTGVVSAANSLVGSKAGDRVGSSQGQAEVEALNNGHYVVGSPNWDNGVVTDAGAATWGSGVTGATGPVTVANSLVGSKVGDGVGAGVKALHNGNFVVSSYDWDSGVATDVGAVTWCSGTAGTSGVVSAANSLVGSTANDSIASGFVEALNNGHYIVGSPNWDNGAATDVGAVTWGNGTAGVTGVVSAANSLVGVSEEDYLGEYVVTALANGNYVVRCSDWDNGATVNAGAISLGNGTAGTTGAMDAGTCVLGTAMLGGYNMVYDYDLLKSRLVVGHRDENRVTLVSDPAPPVIAVLGTNGLAVANGAGAGRAAGTDFGHLLVGNSLGHTLSITNAYPVAQTISGWTTNGAGASAFTIDGIPASIPAFASAQFHIAFHPSATGMFDAALRIANNATHFTVSLRGSAAALSVSAGPFAGGNSITITNGTLGSGADITNVLVGGVAATITGQGTDWVIITVPPTGSEGLMDIVIQSTSVGATVLAGAYTVLPAAPPEPLVIESFNTSGTLTFNALTNATAYWAERAPQAGGPWIVLWGQLSVTPSAGQTLTAMFPMTAAVPMFYRLTATFSNSPPPSMALIPGGTNSGIDPDSGAYSLAVSTFHMDRAEVSKSQWDEVYNWAITHGYDFDNAGSGKAPDHPVQTVNWYDCVKWCNARSEKEGKPVSYRVGGAVYRSGTNDAVTADLAVAGYRLPTTTEWQYAARGGLSGKLFPWGDTINHDHANYTGLPSGSAYDLGYAGPDARYSGTAEPHTSPVGSFPATGYGLYDIAGNVYEWCSSPRFLHGGSYGSQALGLRVTYPGGVPLDYAVDSAGFRTVLPPAQPPPPDTTAPADVSAFTATAGDEQVTLAWQNPDDFDFAGVRIQRKTGGSPADRNDGTTVYSGTGTSTVDSGLTNGTTYFYKAFSYDAVPNYSGGAIATTAPRSLAPDSMALIPAGSFQMGDSFGEGDSGELPVHTVSVKAFYMDKYEVTKALWDEVAAWGVNNGYTDLPFGTGKASNHSVHSIAWFAMVKWCNARSEKEGRTPAYYTSAAKTTVYRTGSVGLQNDWVRWDAGYRLPTEAEWEKAARGGVSGRRFPWSDSDTIQHMRANYYSTNSYSYDTSATRSYHPDYDDGGNSYASPVGAFAPNGYGLHDMAGNVWEWCWDWYSSGYYGTSPGADPPGADSGSNRVIRGGSWYNFAVYCRVAFRSSSDPADGGGNLGFRAVLPPVQ